MIFDRCKKCHRSHMHYYLEVIGYTRFCPLCGAMSYRYNTKGQFSGWRYDKPVRKIKVFVRLVHEFGKTLRE